MGFDLNGLKPQENTKKPEILIKHPIGWQIEDEAIQEEWFNALRTPGPVRNRKKFKRKPKHPKKDLGED